MSKVLYARNRVNRPDKATPFNLNTRTMGRKKRFCKKHGISHFPPTGKKCPGPEFSEISLSGEVKEHTGQQGGIDVDVDLLQGSIPSIPKKHLAADHLTPAVDESLSERVMAVEEALEENSERLDQILELLKEGKDIQPCVKPTADDTPMKPERASRKKTKAKNRTPSPACHLRRTNRLAPRPRKRKGKRRTQQGNTNVRNFWRVMTKSKQGTICSWSV